MSIRHTDVNDEMRLITISGRLDFPGTDSIATQLIDLTAQWKRAVVIDLSGVRFLASIGIRALITSAKAVQQNGGRTALVVDEGSGVAMSLAATAVDKIIPVFTNLSDAERAALA